MLRPTWYPAARAAARTFPLAGLVLAPAGCVRVPGAQACVGVTTPATGYAPADPSAATATASVCVDLETRP